MIYPVKKNLTKLEIDKKCIFCNTEKLCITSAKLFWADMERFFFLYEGHFFCMLKEALKAK